MSDTRHVVLAVDDVPENIAILAAALSATFTVRAATSGERALAICQSDRPPNLVLLDLVMPGMDGFAVLRALAADPRTAPIPVVIVSGSGAPDDEERAFALGAVDWITKPFSTPVLRKRVQAHLELRALRDRIEEQNRQMAAYLPRQLTQPLHSGVGHAVAQTRRRKLTVFFSDIVGFARQTELLAPEDLTRLLNAYFDTMTALVERYDGTLDKFIGDGLMVFFGDPDSQGEAADAARCVAMALDMQKALLDLRTLWRGQGVVDPLHVRMGIATDYGNVGSFGSENRLNYTILGRPVNLAARLQAAAEPDEVLVSPATYALTREQFTYEPTAPLCIKGIDDALVAWRVLAPGGDRWVRWSAEGAEVRVAPESLVPERRAELAKIVQELLDRLRR